MSTCLEEAEECLWIVFFSVRSGKVRVLSFKVGVILLCSGQLEDKYRCEYDMFI